MDDHDLNLIGTCCAIEALADCADTSHWPESARALLRHASELAAIARRENRVKHHLAEVAATWSERAKGRRECMSYQGVN